PRRAAYRARSEQTPHSRSSRSARRSAMRTTDRRRCSAGRPQTEAFAFGNLYRVQSKIACCSETREAAPHEAIFHLARRDAFESPMRASWKRMRGARPRSAGIRRGPAMCAMQAAHHRHVKSTLAAFLAAEEVLLRDTEIDQRVALPLGG